MALHREIFWVGRQWAVTGYGLQACDQKQKGKFDIEASRLWEDGLLERLRGERWLNAADFDRALAIARKQYPQPPREASASEERVLDPVAAVPQPTKPRQTRDEEKPVEERKPAAPAFSMRIESWPAKFVPQWRIRIKR